MSFKVIVSCPTISGGGLTIGVLSRGVPGVGGPIGIMGSLLSSGSKSSIDCGSDDCTSDSNVSATGNKIGNNHFTVFWE